MLSNSQIEVRKFYPLVQVYVDCSVDSRIRVGFSAHGISQPVLSVAIDRPHHGQLLGNQPVEEDNLANYRNLQGDQLGHLNQLHLKLTPFPSGGVWPMECLIVLRTVKITTRTITKTVSIINCGLETNHLGSIFRDQGVCFGATGLAVGPNLGSAVPVKDGVLPINAPSCSGSGARDEETSAVLWDIGEEGSGCKVARWSPVSFYRPVGKSRQVISYPYVMRHSTPPALHLFVQAYLSCQLSLHVSGLRSVSGVSAVKSRDSDLARRKSLGETGGRLAGYPPHPLTLVYNRRSSG